MGLKIIGRFLAWSSAYESLCVLDLNSTLFLTEEWMMNDNDLWDWKLVVLGVCIEHLRPTGLLF